MDETRPEGRLGDGSHTSRQPESSEAWQKNLAAIERAAPQTAVRIAALHQRSATTSFEGVGSALVVRGPLGKLDIDDTPITKVAVRDAEAVLALGIGDGTLVGAHLARSAAKVLVVEPESGLLAYQLHRFDWSTAIAAGALHFFVPPCGFPEIADVALREAAVALAQHLPRNSDRFQIQHTGSTCLHSEFFESLVTRLKSRGEMSRRAPSWPAPARTTRFDVTVVSPNCAIFDDLAACFTRLGKRANLIRVPDRSEEWPRAARLKVVKQLCVQPSRAVIQRNRVLSESPRAEEGLPIDEHIPGRLTSWWWDVPNVASMLDLREPWSQRPAFAFARGILPLLPSNSSWLPPAARSSFAEAEPSVPALGLTFVGQSRTDLIAENLSVLARALNGGPGTIGSTLVEGAKQVGDVGSFYRLLNDWKPALDADLATLEPELGAGTYYLRYLFDMARTAAFRLAAVKILAPLGIAVYGDEGWVRSGAVPASQWRGLVAPDQLPKLYAASHLNLNVNFMQVSTTVNPKVLDACAARGAVLTDPGEELADLFADESVRPFTFSGLDELPDRAADLLRADLSEHRREVSSHVREKHLMIHRARSLEEALLS